jgi:S1-C subfamily serine protease
MKYLASCFGSAVLGALFAMFAVDTTVDDAAFAQDQRGPALAAPTKPKAKLKTVPVFRDDGLSNEEAIAVDVYDRVNRSVVHITTRTARAGGLFQLDAEQEGTGSGAVIDKEGHILTNYHVIEDARNVAATIYNGKTYEASFVGADAINDLAIIKIDAPRNVLSPLTFGDSSQLKVGMRVFAFGNPFGLERTMTTGIISSLNRSLQIRANRTIKSIIQIDAAVNPGNSGGPLIDSHGRLIGINTAIASKTGQNSGVGFAIPVSLVARVVPQLVEHGRVIRAEIGIQRVYETGQGLLIARLVPNGPADRAGLKGPAIVRERRGPFLLEREDRSAADLIIEIDGRKIETAEPFLAYIEGRKPGDRVTLTVRRGGRRVEVPVTLGGKRAATRQR